jgi:hypothetical protein
VLALGSRYRARLMAKDGEEEALRLYRSLFAI